VTEAGVPESSQPGPDDLTERGSLGHLLFLLGLGAAGVWYLADVLIRARHVESVLLVGVMAPPLLLLIAVEAVREARRLYRTGSVVLVPADWGGATVLAGLMAAFAAMIAALPWAGFDAGMAAYLVVSLLVQGERRPAVLASAAAGGVAIGWAIARLLPYGAPTLLF
jgi:hypothetical protein